MNNLKNIDLIISKKFKKKLFFMLFLMILTSLFELISLGAMYQILSFFSNSNIQSGQLLNIIKNFPNYYSIEVYLIITFFLLFFLKTSIYFIYYKKETHFKSHCVADVSSRLFKGYMSLPKLFHLRSNISETIKNIIEESGNFSGVLDSLMTIVLELIVLIVILTYLLSIEPVTVILIFISLIIFSIFFHKINQKPISQMGIDRAYHSRNRLNFAYQGLSGSNIYEITNKSKFIEEKFTETNFNLANINQNTHYRRAIIKPIYEILILFMLLLILIFVLQTGNQLKEIIPELGVFLIAGYRLIPSFIKIISCLQRFTFFIPPVSKLRKDFDNFEYFKGQNKDTGKSLSFENKIELKNISFTYKKKISEKKEDNVFKNLNFSFNFKDKIGIIGKSGVGKSTLLDILMGLLPVNNGEILIDGKSMEAYKKDWQKSIGCVPQDVFIFDGSIKKNIAFGVPDEKVNLDKINKAIKLANLVDFCNESKFGLNTLIGKNGSRISGGQKQRIGIARALYSEPNVLIFDEATSALDEITEKKIITDIHEHFDDKTVLIVTHKRENLKKCNKIFEIESNNINQIK